jgi:hypothetical protein
MIEEHTLDRAAAALWHSRDTLFVRHKHLSEDRRLTRLAQCCN